MEPWDVGQMDSVAEGDEQITAYGVCAPLQGADTASRSYLGFRLSATSWAFLSVAVGDKSAILAGLRRLFSFSPLLPVSLLGSHVRKQDNVADRVLICQEHHDPVDADSDSGSGRHSV